MSVEIWVRTAGLNQTGPARIVTFSGSPEKRNFTIGQEGKDIHFRVRTPMTGQNGSRICLKAKSVLVDQKIHRLVATFNHGVERLSVDGRYTGGSVRGDIDYLPDLVKLGINTAAKIAFCLASLFPLGFLIGSLLQRKNLAVPIMVVGLILLSVEMTLSIRFGQPFALDFFLIGIFASAAGGYVQGVFREI